ncbi:MAG: hypothetical protein AAF654_00805 [Myxococcota bacterium]
MRTSFPDSGAARVTSDHVANAAAGAETAVAEAGPKDYMDDRTARRIGSTLLRIGVGVLAVGAGVATVGAGTALAAPVAIGSLCLGAVTTTMGAALRFQGLFGGWIPDRRPPEARN